MTAKLGSERRKWKLLTDSGIASAQLILGNVVPVWNRISEALMVHGNVKRRSCALWLQIRHIKALKVERLTVVLQRERLSETVPVQQWHRERESQRLVAFEIVPVDAVKARKITFIASVLARFALRTLDIVLLDAFFAVFVVILGKMVRFQVLLDAVFTVINAVLAVHGTGRTMMRKFTAAIGGAAGGVWKSNVTLGRIIMGDAAIGRIRGAERRNVFIIIVVTAGKLVRIG